MKIAIVGSREQYWTHEQKVEAIRSIAKLLVFRETPLTLVSGGCHLGGPDIWAEVIAIAYGLETEIYLPDDLVWSIKDSNRRGFKERNIEIAESCDELHCYTPFERQRGGAIWTAKYAEELDKRVVYHRF